MLASNQKILPEKTLIIFVKIYLVDVGLLRRLAQLAPTAFSDGNSLFTEFKLSIYLLKKLYTSHKTCVQLFITYPYGIMLSKIL